jgi:D-lactate dehydrogenase (cytochrome)
MTDPLDDLRARLGSDNVTTIPTVLYSHGRDENFPDVRPPLAVAYANDVADVQTVLGWCRAHSI